MATIRFHISTITATVAMFVGLSLSLVGWAEAGGQPAKAREKDAKKATTSGPASKPEPNTTIDTPQVEVFIPSMRDLVDAARRSKTADIYRALAGMVPVSAGETDDSLDVKALLAVLEHTSTWPDTSLVFATFTQDRDGRARWAVRVDWPLADMEARLDELLKLEATGKVIKDLKLRRDDDGVLQLELPDLVLAVLKECVGGCVIASHAGLPLPERVFGQEAKAAKKPSGGDSVDGKHGAKSPTKSRYLVYCRLNLAGGEDDEGESSFAMISGVKDVRYAAALGAGDLWREKLAIRWHPAFGMLVKTAVGKLKKPFHCPRESWAMTAFNAGLGKGLVDELAGFPLGTIGGRVSKEMAIAVISGTGFLPWPDVYYQFNTNSKDRIISSIRKAIEKDQQERSDEDRLQAWHEERIGDRTVFWRDPSADNAMGIMPVTYRVVIFFDESGDEEEGSKQCRLVLAQTSTWADDAIGHWDEAMGSEASRVALPDSPKAHWQARINWRALYDLANPYLCMLAGLTDDSSLPPAGEELADALAEAVIDVRIEYAGLQATHCGPVPLGGVYVPVVVATSLGAVGDPASEAARERLAGRHLRVLYHHAKLFKQDYGRWPATVAELDGYVDFASHAELLRLVGPKRGVAAGIVAMFTGSKEAEVEGSAEEQIDDSLYVIEWAPEDWKLKFRGGEFKKYETIYIDAEGVIHRVPKVEQSGAPAAERRPDVSRTVRPDASRGAAEDPSPRREPWDHGRR